MPLSGWMDVVGEANRERLRGGRHVGSIALVLLQCGVFELSMRARMALAERVAAKGVDVERLLGLVARIAEGRVPGKIRSKQALLRTWLDGELPAAPKLPVGRVVRELREKRERAAMSATQAKRADASRRDEVRRMLPKCTWSSTQEVVHRVAARLLPHDARALQMSVADGSRDMTEAFLWCEQTGHLDLLRAVWPACP